MFYIMSFGTRKFASSSKLSFHVLEWILMLNFVNKNCELLNKTCYKLSTLLLIKCKKHHPASLAGFQSLRICNELLIEKNETFSYIRWKGKK